MRTITKRLCQFLIIAFSFTLFIGMPKSNAESNLQVMKSSTGSDLYYRNSSEKVYGLTDYDYPTNDYRACWVSHYAGDLSSYQNETSYKAAINKILDNMQSMGMNALVFHIRTHNNAMYNSKLNPISNYWSNVNFDEFDPLTWIIEECHSRGIEFHAWLNPYRVSSTGVSDIDSLTSGFPNVNPASNKANLLVTSGGVILNPGLPNVRNFIVDTCMEIVENYDVDAIHFDDYFYISGVDDSSTRATYNTNNLSKEDFRREQVDLFIEQLSTALHTYNRSNQKCVQLGISPSGVYQNGGYTSKPSYDAEGSLKSPLYSNTSGFSHYGEYLYSDTKYWIDNEWIDYITPQAYWGMEHNGNNFYELTKWWSWCVANKKTNLYMGVGIYMAISSGTSASYWQKNVDEVKSQLLNASMYDEINGICFYKYSSMLSSNTIIQNGVKLISNEYWAKKIPSAIIQTYADEIDNVNVTNVEFNTVNNTATWDAIPNSRGYIVYKVQKGTSVDKNNINHIYEYTQSNSIVLTELSQYDYYVAQVNLANEVGYTTPISASYDIVKDVMASIEALPKTITINDENAVKQIRTIYNTLTQTQKEGVTNYNTLVLAEEKIVNIKNVQVEAIAYANTLNKHITGDCLLPTNEHVTWRYQDNNDSIYYNITTGKKLMNPLAVKIINLIMTYNLNGVLYEHTVGFNVGYLSEEQTGLFYRDDSSSMWEDDIGVYTNDESKFIGWSHYTLTKGNSVSFLAYNNVFEITSDMVTDGLPSCNWTSCCGVYLNKTTNSVTMTLSQAFATATTYGYFTIDSNGLVKSLSNNSTGSTSVTLLPNEVLVIPRYLDKIVSGSFLCPVDGNIVVNDKITLTKVTFDEKTSEEKVNEVITLINALNNPITLADENSINGVNDLYNALTNDEKALITNYQKLVDAVNLLEILSDAKIIIDLIDTIPAIIKLTDETMITTIASSYEILTDEIKNYVTNYNKLSNALSEITNLKLVLANYKETKIKAIKNYLDLNNYSTKQKENINNYLTTQEEAINKCKTTEEVDDVYQNALLTLDSIPTKNTELKNYQDALISSLNNYLDKSLYSSLSQQQINNILINAKTDIEKTTTQEAADIIYSNTLKDLDEIPSSKEELASYKETKLEEINTYLDYTLYSTDKLVDINKIIEASKSLINNALTAGAVDEVIINTKADLDNIPTSVEELALAKDKAIKSITNYLDKALYSSENIEVIETIITNNKTAINNALTVGAVEELTLNTIKALNAVPTFLQELASYKKTKISEIINYLDRTLYSETHLQEINEIIEDTKENINEALTKEKVDEALASGKAVLDKVITLKDELATYLNTKKEELTSYITSLQIDPTYKFKVDSLFNKAVSEMEKVTTKEGIDEIVKNAKALITTYLNKVKNALVYLDTKKSDVTGVNDLIALIKEQIINADNIEDVQGYLDEFETRYNELIKASEKKGLFNCKKDQVYYIISLISIITIGCLVFKKKDN